MAMYHLSVKAISRRKGQSAVASAAYRSGEKLYSHYDGQIYDYPRKSRIIHKEILIPINAPHVYRTREILWNAVEAAEKRSDSRLAREIELALPNEISLSEQIILIHEFIYKNFISQGMCADIAIHTDHQEKKDSREENPHAHIMLTTRCVDENGFNKKKARDWDKRDNVTFWREQWADIQNAEYERKDLGVRVSHESFIKQGLDREPSKHIGHRATELERRGIQTDRGNENRLIIARNEERDKQKERQNLRNFSHFRDVEKEMGR